MPTGRGPITIGAPARAAQSRRFAPPATGPLDLRIAPRLEVGGNSTCSPGVRRDGRGTQSSSSSAFLQPGHFVPGGAQLDCLSSRVMTLAGIRRAVFARHANPWSAWSRWATTPLILVPVWRRSWRDAAWVSVWFALNPVIFGEPTDQAAWSTRAMLGEEQWVTDRPRDAALLVNLAGSAATTWALLSACRRRLLPTVAATAAAMTLTMGYWALMVRYFDRRRYRGEHG